MPLTFTDEQWVNMTAEALDLPKIIDDPVDGTGLIQQRAAQLESKDALYVTDQQNKVFTDFWIGVLESYYNEIRLLNDTQYTNYDDANIDLGGQQIAPHYSPTWPHMVPILIDENNGIPTSAWGGTLEQDHIDQVTGFMTIYKDGFNDAAVNTTLDQAYTPGDGQVYLVSGTVPVNGRILVQGGGNVVLFKVTGHGVDPGYCTGDVPPGSPDEGTCLTNGGVWTPDAPYHIVELLSDDLALPLGASADANHPGYSNSVRGRQSGSPDAFQIWLEGKIEDDVDAYEASVVAQKVIVDGNEDNVPARKSQNENESGLLQDVLDAILDWEDDPLVDANGKFTDTGLAKITDQTTLRTARIPVRETEIEGAIGVDLVQAGDGTVTGTGAAKSLWDFLLVRISKAGGTLVGWYSADLGLKFFDTKIDNANATLDNYTNTFAIAQIDSDTTVGQTEFTVDDVSEFSVSDSVRVMDDSTTTPEDRSIDDIQGSVITLSSGLSNTYLLDNRARIVKQK